VERAVNDQQAEQEAREDIKKAGIGKHSIEEG